MMKTNLGFFVLILQLSTLVFDSSSCVDNYLNFEEQTFGNNSENRVKLYQAFNSHSPYSVVVTYQTVFPNGTRVNISTGHRCPTERVWMWHSSPVFLIYVPSVMNRDILLTLNYFKDWIPPHLTLTTPYPCDQHTSEFLTLMTSLLQSYAKGKGLGGSVSGYVQSGCYANAYNFIPDLSGTLALPEISAVAAGVLFGFFSLLAPFMQLYKNTLLNDMSEKTFSYTYEHYGLFWGLSTTLCFCTVALLYFNGKTLSLMGDGAGIFQYIFPAVIAFLGCACAAVATCLGVKLKIAIPSAYLLPTSLLCCCSKRRARVMITSIVLWFNLVTIQFACHHGFVIILALSVAPIVITANVMLLVLVFSCFVHIIALVFTICASVATFKCRKPARSCLFIVRALLLIPFLVAVICFCAVVAFAGQYVPTEQNGFLTAIKSLIAPVIFSVLSFGLKNFISKWLEESMREQQLNGPVYEKLD